MFRLGFSGPRMGTIQRCPFLLRRRKASTMANNNKASENRPVYGPNNPHPLSTLSTELVWDGKY
ncbi:MAG: hypothetical protein DRP56_07010, partial [Planctomycetota bacterium]